MPKREGSKRGARRTLGLAMLAWRAWRWLPPKQRRKVLGLARKHGPKLVRTAWRARRAKRRLSRR
jgi:hypothetical protein